MNALLLVVLLSIPGADRPRPLQVDINPPSTRSDLLSPEWENWTVEGPSAARTFGGVTVNLSAQRRLVGEFYKPITAYGATMAADGVSDPEAIRIRIDGLARGLHTLTTYHNRLDVATPAAIEARSEGVDQVPSVTPTSRARDDDEVASIFHRFSVGDAPTIITLRSVPGPGDARVILNGVEIDAADPRCRAIKPVPAHADEHADADSGSMVLRWKAPDSARAHDVYFGSDLAAVEAAEPDAPEYRGRVEQVGRAVDGLSPFVTYFWRVDEIDAGGSIHRGLVWRFRPRQLAFPGAEGYGRFARGGRGGRVIEVTNLEDSGPGSFRAAVEAEGPRTVVFRVSGVIPLRSQITLKHPNLTVAGQTAPGDGICTRGFPVGTASGSHDIIIRYLRIRVGDESGHPYNGTGLGGDHTIMDHCSISWSMDEGLSTRTARDVTFQRCIIAEALHDSVHRHPHAYAASIGGDIASFHHNLLVHCAGRNWSLAGGLDNAVRLAGHLDIRNNVVYNWEHRTTDGGAKEVDFVNNYYKPGPASRVFHLMKPDVGSPGDRQVYYIAGNVMEGHPEYDADNWAGVFPNGDAPLDEIRSDKPLFPPFVRTTSAVEAYEDVLMDVGANLPKSDALDRRVIRETKTGTFTHRGSKTGFPGIIDSQFDLGPDPWPTYRTAEVPADADHDGMPDAWESARGLDPNSPAGDFSEANADPDGDGYTRLEDYLNELAARPSP